MTIEDDEYLDYVLELERAWKKKLEKEMPISEKEWLNIFPDAINIIPEKIKEWEEVATCSRTKINKKIQETRSSCRNEDYWFWEDMIKYSFDPVKDLAIANWNIKRLKFLLPGTNSKQNNRKLKWEKSLEIARGKNILDVAQTYNLRLQKNGKSYKAVCPFHNEKTPSFHIYPPTHFVCYGCSAKGDVIKFVEMIDRSSFNEAVYKLQNL